MREDPSAVIFVTKASLRPARVPQVGQGQEAAVEATANARSDGVRTTAVTSKPMASRCKSCANMGDSVLCPGSIPTHPIRLHQIRGRTGFERPLTGHAAALAQWAPGEDLGQLVEALFG